MLILTGLWQLMILIQKKRTNDAHFLPYQAGIFRKFILRTGNNSYANQG